MGEQIPPAVTELLSNWGGGNQEALNAVLPQLYDELRRIAHRYLRKERRGHTLQSTALVHEAYLRLEQYQSPHFQNRSHFLATCALLMRQILVGHERTRRAAKRGAGGPSFSIEDVVEPSAARPVDLLALNDALEGLARLDPKQSQVVELRFFGGLSIAETAEALELSPATVKRYWETARVWLHREMSRDGAK